MKIAVLTGAGVSAESGIKTFRDSDGLWENYNVEDVASIDGWYRNPELVQNFYNDRRAQLEKAQPNQAHKLISWMERDHDVTVITQNVDNLHERAGSTKVIHLHGELTKVRSVNNDDVTIDIGYRRVEHGEKMPDGSLMRPFIVWFGEAVPMIEKAADIISECDLLLVVGTSLQVYPAAGLLYYAGNDVPVYLIDPKPMAVASRKVVQIQDKATAGMREFIDRYL